MRLTALISIASILPMSALMSGCGTTSVLRTTTIPLREGLTLCEALAPVPPEAMIPQATGDEARDVQIQERAFWMSRDLAQTATVRAGCAKQAELVALIRENNEGAE